MRLSMGTGGRLPVVLTRDEVRQVLERLDGTYRVVAMLLYGSGLRLLEAVQLRGKGSKDRITVLPEAMRPDLLHHLDAVRALHERDLTESAGWAPLPGALGRKLPNAGREWPWQFVFPAARHYADPVTKRRMRHHLHESAVQRAVREAVRRSGIPKHATCHTFRHSFATHLLEDGYDIRTVQELRRVTCSGRPVPGSSRLCAGRAGTAWIQQVQSEPLRHLGWVSAGSGPGDDRPRGIPSSARDERSPA